MRPFVLLLFALLLVVEARRGYRRHYYGRNRHTKQVHRYVNSPLDCEIHEKFEKCGPELHCELTCENIHNPPNCQAVYNNPKCYFPRCICDHGYVRHHGKCVLETYCNRHHHRDCNGKVHEISLNERIKYLKRCIGKTGHIEHNANFDIFIIDVKKSSCLDILRNSAQDYVVNEAPTHFDIFVPAKNGGNVKSNCTFTLIENSKRVTKLKAGCDD